MLDFNNPWISGIGTGLLSSAIIYLLIYVVNRVKRKSLYKLVYDKSLDILLKYIDISGLPSEKVILSVINVTANQHNIDPHKIDTKKILDELFVQLIKSNKYSNKKTLQYLKDIENRIINKDILRSDIDDMLYQDPAFKSIISDSLVSTNHKVSNFLVSESNHSFEGIVHLLDIIAPIVFILSLSINHSITSSISFGVTYLIISGTVIFIRYRFKK